jgi:putative ABC transport system permease protein
VILHPPSADQLPPHLRDAYSTANATIYAVLALVGVMALIEVVLLAGPAFAVGARRQSRNLALISANGGTPTQSRRVILGSAVVIGAGAASAGVVLGIGLGRFRSCSRCQTPTSARSRSAGSTCSGSRRSGW